MSRSTPFCHGAPGENMDHIKRHYYGSQRHVNPTGVVPLGPELDFLAPHDRGRFGE